MRFEVVASALLKIQILWDVTLCHCVSTGVLTSP